MGTSAAFTSETAAGFGALELAEMNAAYARLSARRRRATGREPSAEEGERLRALVRDAVETLRGAGGWAPNVTDIVAEVERREPSYPPP